MAKKHETKPDSRAALSELAAGLRKMAHEERIKVAGVQAGLVARLARIGDLEGSIITANEMASIDIDRALARLESAEMAFKKAD